MFEYLKQFDGGIVVTYNGFRRALEKCDIFMSPADCKEAFSELDLDDSGGITYEEFIQRMFGKVVSTTVTDSQTTVTAVKRLHSNVERKIRNLKGSPSKVFYQFRMLGGAGGNGISLKHFTLALQKMGIRAEVNLVKALFESLVNGAMLLTYKIFLRTLFTIKQPEHNQLNQRLNVQTEKHRQHAGDDQKDFVSNG